MPKHDLLVGAIIRSHHIEIDHLVGDDTNVIAQQALIENMIENEVFCKRGLSDEIIALNVYVSNAAFKVGFAFGMRFAQEVEGLTQVKKEN